jgi:hypothetical protein
VGNDPAVCPYLGAGSSCEWAMTQQYGNLPFPDLKPPGPIEYVERFSALKKLVTLFKMLKKNKHLNFRSLEQVICFTRYF